MSGIQIHRNETLGVELRIIQRDDAALTSLEDLAAALGYARARKLADRLRDHHIVKVPRAELGMPPGNAIRYVTEAGLYRAVMGSQLPAAEEFQDWVTDDVLPSIRRTGRYETPTGAIVPMLRELIAAPAPDTNDPDALRVHRNLSEAAQRLTVAVMETEAQSRPPEASAIEPAHTVRYQGVPLPDSTWALDGQWVEAVCDDPPGMHSLASQLMRRQVATGLDIQLDTDLNRKAILFRYRQHS